jgi:hypothetical protein
MITHFLALGITAAPSGGTALVAVDLVTDAATVGSPALGVPGMAPVREGFGGRRRFKAYVPPERVVPEPEKVVHALAAGGVAGGAAQVGAPAIGQVHGVSAAGVVTDAAAVGQPGLTRSFARNDEAFWALAA